MSIEIEDVSPLAALIKGKGAGAKPMANKVGMSKGGVAKKNIDGAALRGKTKGRMY